MLQDLPAEGTPDEWSELLEDAQETADPTQKRRWRLRAILQDAIRNGDLAAWRPAPVETVCPETGERAERIADVRLHRGMAARDDVVRWLERRNALPAGWRFYLPAPEPAPEKPPPAAAPEMTPKAQGSVLTVLAAMLGSEYGMDWPDRDRETFAHTLRADFSRVGIELPMDDRTLLKYINKAALKMTVLHAAARK